MLSIVRRFSARETEKAFRLFISWAVRLLIAGGGRSGAVEEGLATMAKDVNDGKISTAKQVAGAGAKIIPTDPEFEAAFATARVSQNFRARYYLRALELKYQGSSEPEWIPNESIVINLEHVLPENPGPNWPKIDPETAGAYYKRIGNMVLLQATKNTMAGNSSFSDKKPFLSASKYYWTSIVTQESDWGPQEINSRQKKLAALAVTTWPITVR